MCLTHAQGRIKGTLWGLVCGCGCLLLSDNETGMQFDPSADVWLTWSALGRSCDPLARFACSGPPLTNVVIELWRCLIAVSVSILHQQEKNASNSAMPEKDVHHQQGTPGDLEPPALCYIPHVSGCEHPPNFTVMAITECGACRLAWGGRQGAEAAPLSRGPLSQSHLPKYFSPVAWDNVDTSP